MSKLFSKLSLSSKDKNATPETSKVSSSSTTPASTSSATPQQDNNMSSSTAAPTSTGPSVSQSTTQSKGPTAKIAVIIWSLYGHIASLTEPIVEGAKATGAEVEVFQVSSFALSRLDCVPRYADQLRCQSLALFLLPDR